MMIAHFVRILNNKVTAFFLLPFLLVFISLPASGQNLLFGQCSGDPAALPKHGGPPEGSGDQHMYGGDCGEGRFGAGWNKDIQAGTWGCPGGVCASTSKHFISDADFDTDTVRTVNGDVVDVAPGTGSPNPRDIWPSRTGCYNPEERFIEANRVEVGPTGNKALRVLAPVANRAIPDDSQLIVSPYCKHVYGEFLWFPGINGLMPAQTSAIDPSKQGGSSNAANLLCITEDYLDDVDEFCRDFLPELLVKNVPTNLGPLSAAIGALDPNSVPTVITNMLDWLDEPTNVIPKNPFYPGYQRVLTFPDDPAVRALYEQYYDGIAATCASGICEMRVPAIVKVNSEDSYLPKGYLRDGTCGEYGYNDSPLLKNYASTTFNPNNIYEPESTTPLAPEEILDPANWGQKKKRLFCLRLYLTEWAHRADCGEIVLSGARSDISEGHCQFVSTYNAAGLPQDITNIDTFTDFSNISTALEETTGFKWPNRGSSGSSASTAGGSSASSSSASSSSSSASSGGTTPVCTGLCFHRCIRDSGIAAGVVNPGDCPPVANARAHCGGAGGSAFLHDGTCSYTFSDGSTQSFTQCPNEDKTGLEPLCGSPFTSMCLIVKGFNSNYCPSSCGNGPCGFSGGLFPPYDSGTIGECITGYNWVGGVSSGSWVQQTGCPANRFQTQNIMGTGGGTTSSSSGSTGSTDVCDPACFEDFSCNIGAGAISGFEGACVQGVEDHAGSCIYFKKNMSTEADYDTWCQDGCPDGGAPSPNFSGRWCELYRDAFGNDAVEDVCLGAFGFFEEDCDDDPNYICTFKGCYTGKCLIGIDEDNDGVEDEEMVYDINAFRC